jgi:enoyl-CoA hydratase
VNGELLASYEGDVLVLTIDNPPLNVMTASSWDALDGHLDDALRRGVRGIIVTGAGDRSFCAGSNIKEMLDLDEVTGSAWSRRNYAVREKLRSFPWPVVAAINGPALGGGLALALACDIRVAVRTAEFGLPEARVGLVGTANYLLRYFPPGKVKEMVFTGRRVSAEQGHDWGLIEQVVEPGEALAAARALLEETFSMSPRAVRLYKTTINQGIDVSLEASLSIELERLQECWGSAERRAWVQSYLDARVARTAQRTATG